MRTIRNPRYSRRKLPRTGLRRWAGRGAWLVVALGTVVSLTGVASAEPVQVLAIAQSFDQVLNNMRNWLVGILAGLSTVCLTVSGARYVITSGDPGEVERAKTGLRAACVGYGLAILAPLIVEVLKSIVGA